VKKGKASYHQSSMDNVTHSLIGVALGHVVLKAFERGRSTDQERTSSQEKTSTGGSEQSFVRSPRFRALVLWTSILSNNAPDSDVVFPWVMKTLHLGGNDPRITQLLQHRGFTHTVAAAPVLGFISLALAWVFSGASRSKDKAGTEKFKQQMSRNGFWLKLWGLGMLGVLCHLGADFWNDYGIHPFWPLSNHWFYGDFIFIVEPLIWFSILPLAFFESKRRSLQGFVLFLFFLMIGLIFFGPYSSWFGGNGMTVAVLGWAAFAWFWQWRVSKAPTGKFSNFIPAVGLLSLVLLMFFVCSQTVGKGLTELMAKEAPAERIVQLARSPAPANPFCWRVLVASVGPGDRYTVRLASVSLLPEWPTLIDSTHCLEGTDRGHAAPLEKVTLPSAVSSQNGALANGPLTVTSSVPGLIISWHGEFSRPFHELVKTSDDFCRFEALRQFARAPFWAFSDGEWIGGDLRYDRQAGKGFATLALGTPGDKSNCPKNLPGWDPPIAFP
jgi:inner membrane protein